MKKDSPNKSEMVGWAYVRVSTVDQGNVGHGSLEQQLNRIKRWESEQTLHTGVMHRITRFIDEDISGRAQSLHKRREYHELTNAIQQKIIDFVVVEKLNCLHRNVVESRRFIDLCDSMGVKFYRLDGGLVDFRDRSSRTSVFIESWMAEEYSLDLVEKLTKKGREARVNNGKDSSSVPILGLDEHPTEACFYVINKQEQEIVKDIFRHFCRCQDLQQTASYCNLKGYKTKQRYTRPKLDKGKKIPPKLVGGETFDRKNLRAMLVNRKIAGFGFFKDDWDQFPGRQDENGLVRWEYRHGSVIDTDLFEKTQAILRKNAKYNHRMYEDQRIYFLSGILFDRDGNKFCGQSVKKKKNPYYVNPKKKFRVRAERIEKAVLDFLSSLIKKNGLLEEAVKKAFNGENTILKSLDAEIAQNTKALKQCEQVISILSDRSQTRIIEQPERMEEILLEASETRKQSMQRMEELRAQAAELHMQKEQIGKFEHCNDVQNNLKKALKTFETSTSKRKKRLIEMLVPKFSS